MRYRSIEISKGGGGGSAIVRDKGLNTVHRKQHKDNKHEDQILAKGKKGNVEKDKEVQRQKEKRV
jgi:hypothetical protein